MRFNCVERAITSNGLECLHDVFVGCTLDAVRYATIGRDVLVTKTLQDGDDDRVRVSFESFVERGVGLGITRFRANLAVELRLDLKIRSRGQPVDNFIGHKLSETFIYTLLLGLLDCLTVAHEQLLAILDLLWASFRQ